MQLMPIQVSSYAHGNRCAGDIVYVQPTAARCVEVAAKRGHLLAAAHPSSSQSFLGRGRLTSFGTPGVFFFFFLSSGIPVVVELLRSEESKNAATAWPLILCACAQCRAPSH